MTDKLKLEALRIATDSLSNDNTVTHALVLERANTFHRWLTEDEPATTCHQTWDHHRCKLAPHNDHPGHICSCGNIKPDHQ